MRWLGWLMLTGGAAAFSVCLNSFNRLSRLHEEDESADGGAGSTANSAHDTAEIAIPPELAAPAAELPVAEASAAEQCAEPQPEPDQLVTAP
jgi:hypothetical protein